MDTISLVASIIAVVQLTTTVVSYLTGIRNASKDQQQCATEASNLLVLLTKLKFRAEQANSTDPWFIEIRALAVDNGVLGQYKTAAERLISRISNNKRSINKIGAAISWPLNKAEVADMLHSIERLKSFISIALGLDHFKLSEAIKNETRLLPDVAQNVEVMRLEHDEQLIRLIADWLSSVDFSQQQNDFIAQRREGTGEWFLQSPEFTNWLGGSTAILFCPGRPGAGKTIISSLVIQHLQGLLKARNCGLAFIFCDYNSQEKQRALDLLLVVLKQLVSGLPAATEAMKAMYEKHKRDKSKPHTLSELINAIKGVTGCYDMVYVVIDALDECSDTSREDLISHLRLLQDGNIKLMVTSRRTGAIEQKLKSFANYDVLEVVANAGDIERFIDGELPRLASCVSRDEGLKRIVISAITEAADGMFILARLHFELLVGETTDRKIRSALKALRKGPKQLFKAYENTITRLENQSPGHTHLARSVLTWIVNAKRPLTVQELQHALATEIGDTDLDEGNRTDIADILSACVGLVVLETGSCVIKLVHYTAHEYLTQNWTSYLRDSQRDMAETCVTYLLFESFSLGACLNDLERYERSERYAFYEYAAQNWGYHVYAASMEKENLVMTFLNSEPKILAAVETMTFQASKNFHRSWPSPQSVTGMHLAAHFGLKETMIALRAAGHGPEPEDVHGRTPIFYAISNGQEQIVRWALDATKIDLGPSELRTTWGETLMHCAAGQGQYAIVELLLRRSDFDVNELNTGSLTPLSLAARGGYLEVVKLLLNVNGVRPACGTPSPLLSAATRGNLEIVRLLLQDGRSDVNSRDESGQTPLLSAIYSDNYEVVNMLLATPGVKVETCDDWGDTALTLAADLNQPSIFKQLLSAEGIKPCLMNYTGGLLLSGAAEAGYLEIVRLLLSDGRAEADTRDEKGRTPLSLASMGRHVEVVQSLLLDPRVDVNARDSNGRTPLSYAASGSQVELVQTLLSDHRVDPNSRDDAGQTPLSHAATDSVTEVVQILLSDHRVNADSRDSKGRTPLSYAASWSPAEVVQALLSDHRVDPNSRDETRRTPLSHAATRSVTGVVQILLSDRRVDPNSRDDTGQTPLSHAANRYEVRLVQALLSDHRVDPNSRDDTGRTPLSHAAIESETRVIQALLSDHRVDPNSRDDNGRTPLSYAAHYPETHENFRLILSDLRVDPDLKDSVGRTPLSYVASSGSSDMISICLSNPRIDPESIDNKGRTPLIYAAAGRHFSGKALQLFLSDTRISPYCEDFQGKNALYYAQAHGTSDAVSTLRADGRVMDISRE